MFQKKTVFIIPGYKHGPKLKAYKEIAKIFIREGYHPILITIPWLNSTISENTEYFLKEYKKINRRKKYILGFSLGAMIAFLASTKVNATGVILCSLAPFFLEDLPKVNGIVKSRKYKDYSKLGFATLAKQIKSKQVLMLYGAKETKSLIRRVNATFDKITSADKYLISIKQIEHSIGDRRYLNKIHQIAKALN